MKVNNILAEAKNCSNSNVFAFLISLLLILIVVSTLTFSNLFIYKSLTPYYLYTLSISIFIVICGVVLLFQRAVSFVISLPIMITAVWAIYILAHIALVSKNVNPFSIYLILNCAFLIALFCLCQITSPLISLVYNAILFIALSECVVCLLQCSGYVQSFNLYFKVTGTWENPNVTAMFIAMALPILFNRFFQSSRLLKRIALGLGAILFFTLLLLQCRTALIGYGVSLTMLLGYKYDILKRLNANKNRQLKIITFLFAFAIVTSISCHLYQAKKASADGRQLIWKIASQMILERPSGYGYGLFARNYNLSQAEYFKNGNGTPEEIQNSGFVHMAYNEFLQNGVEGGLFGLIIISGLFISLITIGLSQVDSITANDKTVFTITYSGIVSFIVMSFFNFSLQAIPSMCLFVIYATIFLTYSAGSHHIRPIFSLCVGPAFKIAGAIFFIVTGVMGCTIQLNAVTTELLIKKAELAQKSSSITTAAAILNSVSTKPGLCETFYMTYGDILYKQKRYAEAVTQFTNAKIYSSDPDIYTKMAFCNIELKNYSLAEQDLTTAINIEPDRLTPRSGLMHLYLTTNNIPKVVATAKEIIKIKPKIPSVTTKQVQIEAFNILQKLNIPLPNQQHNLNAHLKLGYN